MANFFPNESLYCMTDHIICVIALDHRVHIGLLSLLVAWNKSPSVNTVLSPKASGYRVWQDVRSFCKVSWHSVEQISGSRLTFGKGTWLTVTLGKPGRALNSLPKCDSRSSFIPTNWFVACCPISANIQVLPSNRCSLHNPWRCTQAVGYSFS